MARSSYLRLLFIITLGFVGCGVEKPKSGPPKQPTGVITRPGGPAARPGASTTGTTLELSAEKAKTGADSTAPEVVQQSAILDSVLHLLATAGTNPGGDNFTIATEQLNQYFNRNATTTDFTLSQESLKFLTDLKFPDPAIRSLQEPKYTIRDARHIEDCMMYYGLANRIAGNGDDLTRLRRIFDWTSRNIMLVPAGSLAPPGKNQQAQARPYDCMLRGMATEASAQWAERTWIFMSLARQIRIDVGILVSSRSPENWLSVAIVDGKPYLFDCRVGKPVLAADGVNVATLDDAISDPQILGAMQLAGAAPYGPSHADIASGELAVMADFSAGYLTPRMRLLEQRLSGKNRMILFRDIHELRSSMRSAIKTRLKEVQIWDLPLQVEALLFSNPEFVQAAQFPLQIFDFKLPLLAARTAQLRGEMTDSLQKYVTMRFAENALLRDKVTPIPKPVQQIIDIYSTYFLALCHYENSLTRTAKEADLKEADLKQARFFFNETLRLVPEARPDRPFFYMFRWNAVSNLGLMAQDSGDNQTAIRYLSAGIPTADGYRNMLIASEDIWADPFSAPPSPLPAPPEDKFVPPTAEKQPAQDLFDASPGAAQPNQQPNRPAPAAPANRPLPGLGGGAIGISPAAGPRPVGPGGAAGLLPQGGSAKP